MSDLDSLRRRLSSDEINAMPLYHYEGEVLLVRTPEELASVMPLLERERVIGFDTETRPSFRKGRINAPSLVQLATEEAVILVQLSWLPLTDELAALLSDPDHVKTGVAIGDDMRELSKLHPFTPAGLADVGAFARAQRIPSQGLRTLAANLFGLRISKGPQCSNWSVKVLSQRQILYAATDAWISRAIYLRMKELGLVPGGFAA